MLCLQGVSCWCQLQDTRHELSHIFCTLRTPTDSKTERCQEFFFLTWPSDFARTLIFPSLKKKRFSWMFCLNPISTCGQKAESDGFFPGSPPSVSLRRVRGKRGFRLHCVPERFCWMNAVIELDRKKRGCYNLRRLNDLCPFYLQRKE